MSSALADPERGEAPPTGRLRSLDALRGFDMFWIVGGREIVVALAAVTGWPALHWLERELSHPEWHGFRLWDLVFPLFLFVAGVAMPFSLGKRLERGEDRRRLHMHVIRRGLVLVFLGIVYNGLLRFEFDELRYASVLGRIGLAYLFAALIFLNSGVRAQVGWVFALLLGYWMALSWVPVPGFGAGNLAPGATLTDWVDRSLLPGRLHRTVRDPEGILGTVPAIANALIGALAGVWLRRSELSGERRAAGLAVCGGVCAALGWLWSGTFPLNKNLWTSSFVLWTSGLSLVLLAIFYLIIDVRGWRRWSFFFVVIGSNAIAIYMLRAFVDFDGIARVILIPRKLHPALLAAGGLALEWALLYLAYRKRLFLRV